MDRTQREAAAYTEGEVFRHSSELQNRFSHVFTCPNTLRLEKYFENEISLNIKDSIVLDYGCLYGHNCPNLHKMNPKRIVGIDISSEGIEQAKKSYGKIAEFYVMDAHHMDFQSDSFDLIVGRAILHHLDWEVAIEEINRVLRVGGVAIFMEPLGDNLLSKIIRKITHKARTLDEKPLSKEQIQQGDRFFGYSQHMFANLVSVPFAIVSSLISNNPSNLVLKISDRIDYFLSKTFFRYWMRQVVLVWKKTK